ncbi:hypothetical protein LCGC14_2613070, partial [marine sediment metagenome]
MVSDHDRKSMIYTGVAVVVAAGLIVLGMQVFGRAEKVEGATSSERIESIWRLADQKPRGAADAIATVAADDADASVRQAALVALGRFCHPRHRALIETSLTDRNPLVRAGAAGTMGRYDDDKAVGVLGALAATDKEEKVRHAALVGLGRCKSTVAIFHMVRIMATRQLMSLSCPSGRRQRSFLQTSWDNLYRLRSGLSAMRLLILFIAE